MNYLRFSWLKWLKYLFVVFHFILLTTLLLASALIYIAFRSDSMDLFNSYFLEPLGIEYASAEGSLQEGFTLHDIRLENSSAKTLVLQYNLVKMLQGEHTIDSIAIDGLRIQLDDFLSEGDSVWPFPTFKLREVTITNLQLIGEYPIELDIHGKKGAYDGEFLDFNALEVTFKSRYASGAVHGKLSRNSITGLADLYPNSTELAPYSGQYTTLPRAVRVQITELSDSQALLHTTLGHLNSKHDANLSAEAIGLDFRYRYDNDYFDIDARYNLVRGEDSMKTLQHLRYDLSGTTTSEFDGEINTSLPLSSNMLHGEFTDSAEGFVGMLTLGKTALNLSSRDYNRISWNLKSEHNNLNFLPALPEAIRTLPFQAEGEGAYYINSDLLEGRVHTSQDFARYEGHFSMQNGHYTLDGDLILPPDAQLWKHKKLKPPARIAILLNNEHNATQLHLSGDDLTFELTQKGKIVHGNGNYLGAYFDFNGTSDSRKSDLMISTHIPSLFTTVSKIDPIEINSGEFYDAEVRIKSRLTFEDSLRIRSTISLPWYATVLNTQRTFSGTDGDMRLDFNDGNITIERYRFEVADHTISSDRVSHLHLTPTDQLVIDDFWIYDSLLLRGTIEPDMSSVLRLSSERFSYEGSEGKAHARADITFTRDASANQSIEGSLSILDGAITNLPIQQFKVMDDDIIIVQDVRPQSTTKLSMNLHITAENPILYKTNELSVRINPDITLWKDPLGAIEILGMVTLPSGSATTGGKVFTIKPSEIYFGGGVPLNPYLNLTIGHEVDYKKILIFVTHTLDSPIFLFSSDPVMTQSDIMSYILFGGPANSSSRGDNSTSTIRADATNFMLGAGIKGLITGVTKIQIDTMNILTTAQGGMGFEVGARLNKDLRVLYKNNTLSSVLIQYTANRWLRLEADIHELGQGINAVYLKDFRDFLPHNHTLQKPK
ncbi:MAG: translocation/assembly module TamB domain-containing protein [Sulfuricurvum sp.]|nr:translocation/assembly module TamB domain-containing protein [Sulfuricurvum sp.]